MSQTQLRIPLAELKRVLERRGADPAYREKMDIDPAGALAEYGFRWDVARIRSLWDQDYREQHGLSEDAQAYLDHVKTKYALRDRMRSEFEARHPRYQAWRTRQKARVVLELGAARADSIVHAPMCIELNRGCSVGCWFCGISAPKLTDIWPYTPENASLWRSVLATLGDIVGPLARWGFCYWATDPLDNPDYERFCSDYHEVLGNFPQTTTALSLRDPERVRGLLRLSESKGCELNRFSILTLRNFLKVHQTYTAEELLHVECIPQNKESVLTMANAGKASERSGQSTVAEKAGTIACVSGFLFNMVDRSVKLITPCAAGERWPLGYWIVQEGGFETVADLRTLLEGWLHQLPLSVDDLPRIAFARFLEYSEVDDGFQLMSQEQTLTLRHPEMPQALQGLGRLIRDGAHGAAELAMLARYSLGLAEDFTVELLERLFAQGALDEEPA